jgi:flavin reductase (DIM6/NTAB) family NADH-FMN oxidoreductase RutF
VSYQPTCRVLPYVAMSEELLTITESADSALVVVTTVAEDERAGCVVAFHTQSGVDPERYSVWLSKANHTYRVALRAEYFAVHFLRDGDVAVARHFGTQSADDVDKFEDIGWEPGPGGVPLIVHLPQRIVLRKLMILDDGGDHVCLSGEVTEVRSDGSFTPLRLSEVNQWEPGHDVHERAIDPTGSPG